jgi:lipoprotein
MKKLIKMLVVSTILLTGCSSTKAETPQEKAPEQIGRERVASILTVERIDYESDGIGKMEMTTSDFNFVTQKQFHDFVFDQKNRAKFKELKIYLNNNATIETINGDKLMYVIPNNDPILKYDYIHFQYNRENGLYTHIGTNKTLEINLNPGYPSYK